jgi:hypothetical protein
MDPSCTYFLQRSWPPGHILRPLVGGMAAAARDFQPTVNEVVDVLTVVRDSTLLGPYGRTKDALIAAIASIRGERAPAAEGEAEAAPHLAPPPPGEAGAAAEAVQEGAAAGAAAAGAIPAVVQEGAAPPPRERLAGDALAIHEINKLISEIASSNIEAFQKITRYIGLLFKNSSLKDKDYYVVLNKYINEYLIPQLGKEVSPYTHAPNFTTPSSIIDASKREASYFISQKQNPYIEDRVKYKPVHEPLRKAIRETLSNAKHVFREQDKLVLFYEYLYYFYNNREKIAATGRKVPEVSSAKRLSATKTVTKIAGSTPNIRPRGGARRTRRRRRHDPSHGTA